MSLTEIPKTQTGTQTKPKMQGNVFLSQNGEEDGFYSAENQRRLRESIRQAEEGNITEHELIGEET